MPVYKTDPADLLARADSESFIPWNESFSVGIEFIDKQHKHLFALTNQLYQACRAGGDERYTAFKEAMSRVVEYVRFHFTAEQDLLQRVKYPDYAEHKGEHDKLIMQVIDFTKENSENKRFVPNNFVRFLKEWIVGHIGHNDKMYGFYIAEQKKKGLLSDKDIEG